MKFIVNATIAANANKQLVNELEPISYLFGSEWRRIRSALLEEGEQVYLKHISVTRVGDDWVVWIDDEAITRQLAMIGRFTRVLAPLIAAVIQVGKELGHDVAEFRNWLRTPR